MEKAKIIKYQKIIKNNKKFNEIEITRTNNKIGSSRRIVIFTLSNSNILYYYIF